MSDQTCTSFWNEERGVYQISLGDEIISETNDTRTAMDICRRRSEMVLAHEYYEHAKKRFHGLCDVWPPKEVTGDE